MALAGMPIDQPSWRISLEDPRDPERVLAVLIVDQGAVATSTITKRHWYVGDQLRHHIIDPRTGKSCIPAWMSMTVITEKATYAEAFAKALLIAGPQEALEICAGVPGLRWIGISQDGSLWGSQESKELIDVSAQRS